MTICPGGLAWSDRNGRGIRVRLDQASGLQTKTVLSVTTTFSAFGDPIEWINASLDIVSYGGLAGRCGTPEQRLRDPFGANLNRALRRYFWTCTSSRRGRPCFMSFFLWEVIVACCQALLARHPATAARGQHETRALIAGPVTVDSPCPDSDSWPTVLEAYGKRATQVLEGDSMLLGVLSVTRWRGLLLCRLACERDPPSGTFLPVATVDKKCGQPVSLRVRPLRGVCFFGQHA